MKKISTSRCFGLFILTIGPAVIMPVAARAETIEGTIIVKKKLTKRRVTAEVPMYERGPAVELGADGGKDQKDPLAFERERVAIYLEGRAPLEAPADTVNIPKMEQENRRFVPEMLVVQAGSKVSFPNLDPIFHNVFSLSGAKTFDLGNYPKGDTRIVSFPEPGIVFVNCHLHSNMTATIVVAPNKWNTKAGRDGHFELTGVPPGKYTIVAWHKTSGPIRHTVTVTPGNVEHVEFLIPLDDSLPASGLLSRGGN
ncbi:MAG TPA: carboxypeptidase regulatory-like domain-containing protein [Bryobacteraceae bacterium]|nr:carboxypeptidase regulatory-like domain-containing protein [Bryobacteraceae bacterium]